MIAFGLIPPIAIVLIPAILGPSQQHNTDSTKKERGRYICIGTDSQIPNPNRKVGRYKALNITLKLYPIFREVRVV